MKLAETIERRNTQQRLDQHLQDLTEMQLNKMNKIKVDELQKFKVVKLVPSNIKMSTQHSQ